MARGASQDGRKFFCHSSDGIDSAASARTFTDAALLYAYTLLQPAPAARVRAAFAVLGSLTGLAAEATECAMLLQTLEQGENLALTDQLQTWAADLSRRAGE